MDGLSTLRSLLFVILLTISDASHFRGGTVSWKYIGRVGDLYKIDVNFKLGWRRDYWAEGSRCDDETIADENPAFSGGSWKKTEGIGFSSDNEANTIKCTAYDIEENWIYGYNSFAATVNTPGPFDISYTGSAWLDEAEFASGAWVVQAGKIDLAIRSDTDRANNPPTSTISPIVKLSQECAEDVHIAYQDIDNDRVTCRYATGAEECGGACNGPNSAGYEYFHLNQTTCTIHYDGGGENNLVAVSIVLLDHPRSAILLNGSRNVPTSDFLSETPLQFLIEIGGARNCNLRPTYPEQSVQDGDVIEIPSNEAINLTLYAFASSPDATMRQFVVLGPLGMQVTPVVSRGNNLYSANILWTPKAGQSGPYDVCYYASEYGGNVGRQICFTITIQPVTTTDSIDTSTIGQPGTTHAHKTTPSTSTVPTASSQLVKSTQTQEFTSSPLTTTTTTTAEKTSESSPASTASSASTGSSDETTRTTPVVFTASNPFTNSLGNSEKTQTQGILQPTTTQPGDSTVPPSTVINTTEDPCTINNGGCSDICNGTDSSGICSCSSPCMILDSAELTCVRKENCDAENNLQTGDSDASTFNKLNWIPIVFGILAVAIGLLLLYRKCCLNAVSPSPVASESKEEELEPATADP